MAKVVELKECAKTHLKDLASEITTLIGHARPAGKGLPMNCWSTNSEDINVALTVLQAAGSSINDAITRFNIVFKANPGDAASESMAKELAGFCQQMVSSLMLLPSVGASDSMVAFFATSSRAVLHSLKDVVDALLDTSKHAQINGLTGVVWRACKELQQAPKTNKLACRRHMMQWSVAIKDTIDEFQEAAKNKKSTEETADSTPLATATGDSSTSTKTSSELEKMMGDLSMNDPGLQDNDFDFNDDDDDDDMNYSPSELRCVDAALDVLRASRRCLKAANESLNKLDSAKPSGSGEATGISSDEEKRLSRSLAWAQALQGCLSKANDGAAELGVSLYPPLNGGDLSARAEDLERALGEFCDVFDEQKGVESGSSAGSGSVADRKRPQLREIVEETADALRVELAKL